MCISVRTIAARWRRACALIGPFSIGDMIAAAVHCLRRAGASSRLPAQDCGRHSYTVWGALGVSEVRRTIAATLVVVAVRRGLGWEVSMRGTQGLGRRSVAAGVLRQGCAIPVNRVAARSGSPIMKTGMGPRSDSLDTSACPFRGPYSRAGGARYWWNAKTRPAAAMAGEHISSGVFRLNRLAPGRGCRHQRLYAGLLSTFTT